MANKPTRRFFTKVHWDKPPKVRKPPRPNYTQQIVMTTRTDANGTVQYKAMAARDAARQLGRSKGGFASQAKGVAYHWTPEAARAAARKLWDKRYRMNLRIHKRLGMPAKRRPRIEREPLRNRYALKPEKGIRYDPETERWMRGDRPLSERAALTALGHLAGVKQYIPEVVIPVQNGALGTKRVQQKDPKESAE